MERRNLLRGLGAGTGVAAFGAAAVGAEQFGETRQRDVLQVRFDQTVAAKRGRGQATLWWSADTDEPTMALTFDDGPSEEFTARVLDMLADYGVPATFFVVGANLSERTELGERIRDEGHELANHTWDHVPAQRQSRDEVIVSMQRGAEAVAEVTGELPRWFRPVRGNVTGSVMAAAAQLGHDVAIWSISRGAFVEGHDANVASVIDTIPKRAHPGAVALLHDGAGRTPLGQAPRNSLARRREAEVVALPAVLEELLTAGYRLRTMSDLIPTTAH